MGVDNLKLWKSFIIVMLSLSNSVGDGKVQEESYIMFTTILSQVEFTNTLVSYTVPDTKLQIFIDEENMNVFI